MIARLTHSAFAFKSVVVVSYHGISRAERSNEFELVLLPLDGGVENPRCLGAVTARERPFWLGADPIVEAQIDSVRVIDADREPLFLSNRPAIAVPPLAPAQSVLAEGSGARRTRPRDVRWGRGAPPPAASAIWWCSKAAANSKNTTKLSRAAYRLLTRS